MSEKIPTRIIDKNGKENTVHKRTGKPSKKARERVLPSPESSVPLIDTKALIYSLAGISPKKRDDEKITVVYSAVYGIAQEISYIRNQHISANQIFAIGNAVVGSNLTDNKGTKMTVGQLRQIVDSLANDDVDESLYTAYDSYMAAREIFFAPARSEGWVPSADDAFQEAWDGGVAYGRKNALKSDTEPTGRGRRDLTWLQKATAAAEMDAGSAAMMGLGVNSLEPTGDIRRDWHEITGRQLITTIGRWLDGNRTSVSDRTIGGIVDEFLGSDWNSDVAALESDARTPRLVNVRDLREMFAEIAVSSTKAN